MVSPTRNSGRSVRRSLDSISAILVEVFMSGWCFGSAGLKHGAPGMSTRRAGTALDGRAHAARVPALLPLDSFFSLSLAPHGAVALALASPTRPYRLWMARTNGRHALFPSPPPRKRTGAPHE